MKKHANMKKIDCTPTWKAVLPLLLHSLALKNTAKQRDEIVNEFRRMAKAADDFNDLVKKNSKKKKR